MKRILLTIALVAMLAVPASAQVFSLWGDENQTECAAYSEGAPYYEYNVYVFVEPVPGEGTFGAEYKMDSDLPAYLADPQDMWVAPYPNAAITMPVMMGAWLGGDGISLGFDKCYAGTLWLVRVNVTNKFDQTAGNWFLGPVPSDPYGKPSVAICDGPHTKYSADIYNHFGFNQGCTIGTKESSWGAIKGMF